MSIVIGSWDREDELSIDYSDQTHSANGSELYLTEDEVVDLAVALLASMKHKPAMQGAMETKLAELSKQLRAEESRGSNG